MSRPDSAPSIETILQQVSRPKRAVVTAGMPYANGPLHLGHLAGAHVPADIHARWLGMLIGRQNVLYVCCTDEHGSTSELAAIAAGKTIRELVDGVHDMQEATLDRYSIGLDVYSGTSRPDLFPLHKELSLGILKRLEGNGLLGKRVSQQWYDPEVKRFLPDRLVRGKCPNPKCNNEDAYSDECDVCGHQHLPTELINPRSAISSARPELRDTTHLWLDMWSVSETLRVWIQGKQKAWRQAVVAATLDKVLPSIRFAKSDEPAYNELSKSLPAHKRRYAAGGGVELQFNNKPDMEAAQQELKAKGIETKLADEWAHRSITRDTSWGIPIEGDPDLAGKTLYVWPDSLIAPIAFTQAALIKKGQSPERYKEFWCDPEARVYQFLGQDNVFFYVLMQGALWLGSQADPHRLPVAGELQLTDVFGCFHLRVNGEKMSKARGNYYTGDQLLLEMGYSVDQVRYYLALLGLPEKLSDFDITKLDERNKFLAGPMNAAFERPISAVHSKFEGRVPEGVLNEKVVADTTRMVRNYVRAMEKASYPGMLFELENYARTINSLFTQYKPHDDRHPLEGRQNALYTAFYVLKNLMIMLYPFVPDAMERLRRSLALPEGVFRIDELGTPIPAGHAIGQLDTYFPVLQSEQPEQ